MLKPGDRVIAIIKINSYDTCKGISKSYIDTIRSCAIGFNGKEKTSGIRLDSIINSNSKKGIEWLYDAGYFKKLVSDEELQEYKKNVSMKENLSPELIPKKLLTC